MIILYSPFATDFENNGLGVIDDIVTKAEITQELNGDYYLDLEVTRDKREKYKRIESLAIIKADGQLFRVPYLENTQNNGATIIIKAKHIFYDLLYDFNLDARADTKTVQEALEICTAINPRFTITTCSNLGNNTAYFIRENPVKGIFDKILSRWGGELYRDNFNISIKENLGTNTGYLISYAKNIIGFKQKIDYSTLCTKMHPVGKDGLELDEIYLESPRIADYPITFTKEYSFDVVTKTELKNEAEKLWGSIDIPNVSYEVDFAELKNTQEYAKFKDMLNLNLGDTVIIRHQIFNVDLSARIIKTTKNVLLDKYTKIYLGDYVDTLATSINSTESRVSTVESKVEEIQSDLTVSDDIITDHLNSTDIHVTTYDKNIWDTAESNANSYTDNAIYELLDSSPSALDTLNELANALGNDPNFSTTILNLIGLKASQTDLDTVESELTRIKYLKYMGV
ncbi:phage tail spike protein [Clostridium grantii]|uniref:Phage minor structural protein, N-terminal region n=1 Tax=Clostridium grantii DSM 8605 TaxID=1121316 RepID=A0A1M5SBX8_9CLOT|nr:phage tail spike protein [Clostridium grantii]SHH35950.1 phage minor structural protein, N-terminal region [Clostridium grantii DSM 8605]